MIPHYCNWAEKNVVQAVKSRWYIVWKMYKYGVFSGPYFPAFRLNTKIYYIHYEYRKIRIRKNSIFGHFSYCQSFKSRKPCRYFNICSNSKFPLKIKICCKTVIFKKCLKMSKQFLISLTYLSKIGFHRLYGNKTQLLQKTAMTSNLMLTIKYNRIYCFSINFR